MAKDRASHHPATVALLFVGRSRTPRRIVARIEKLARTTEMSVRQIHREIGEEVGRSVVGNIVKVARQTGL